jgi:hypothetical protein
MWGLQKMSGYLLNVIVSIIITTTTTNNNNF